MVKAYEELNGAIGRARHFRLQRFDAGALFAGEPPALFFDDCAYDFKNISASGVGASVQSGLDVDWQTNDGHFGVLRLVQLGEEIFRGSARLARAERVAGRMFTGFALNNDQFDLDELAQLNARAVARSRIAPPSIENVPQEYRALCADVAAFVGAHSMRIERLFGAIEHTLPLAERVSIFTELMASAESDWRALLMRGNRFALSVQDDKPRLAAMKRFTEAAVTPLLARGASWSRGYHKPMGYPGDFRMMNYMYDRSLEGVTIRENFLHGLGLIAGRPIETRMLALSRIVAEHFKGRPPHEPRRVASVGCGPARELQHIVAASDQRSTLTATLIDQEIKALEYALRHARSHYDERRLKISAFNISFKEMFNPADIDPLRDQDVIYSLGLVDYFSPLLARRFVSRAFDLLRPGGKVIIGNASDSPNGTLWAMEHVLDWTLYFRNRDQMAALASEVAGARVSIEVDPLDSIYFLIVEKVA